MIGLTVWEIPPPAPTEWVLGTAVAHLAPPDHGRPWCGSAPHDGVMAMPEPSTVGMRPCLRCLAIRKARP